MVELYQIFVHVAYGHGSVLMWWHVIHYVLPVLWMMSCFYIMALWHIVSIPKQQQNIASITPNFAQQ